jgi:hypothetical protein
MALKVLQFAVTIPPNTLPGAPATIPLALDNWDIESIDLEVPPGPAGLMGFAIFNNGVQWIPATAGQWLQWDDVQASWPFEDQPNASGWSVVGYNEGFFPHTVTVRFHVNSVNPPATNVTAPAVTFISSAPDQPVVTL